jgi:predicted MPP superfamily phosphohydrolase
MTISRRSLLTLIGGAGLSGIGFSSYGFAIEPRSRVAVTRYTIRPTGWLAGGQRLRIAVLADIHACEPWMPVSQIDNIVAQTNNLKPDLVVLLGDYVAAIRRFGTNIIPPQAWAKALAALSAPLGTHAVLGNHDCKTDISAIRAAFEANQIHLMENDSVRLTPTGNRAFWLAGLGDQAERRDDLSGTLAGIPDNGEPLILLAHEPDIFSEVPARVSLTLCGHTHGGQVALPFFGRPIVPSNYGDRYAYGHIVERDRHLIVSGGLGCSKIPVRFGVPPEIVVVDIGDEPGITI